MSSPFSQRAKQLIKQIPLGKVATYGQIAIRAGNPQIKIVKKAFTAKTRRSQRILTSAVIGSAPYD